MINSRILLLAVFILFTNACTTTRTPPQQLDHSAHQLSLTNHQQWQLSGRMAFKGEQETFSANINWSQTAQDYQVRLSSFIGTTLLKMVRENGLVQLETDDQIFTDTQANRLIYRTTGWNIPVDSLSQWIKGQHSDNDQYQLDEFGRVIKLQPLCGGCGNWQISYADYRQVNQVWLPHNLTLTENTEQLTKIKIRISTWTLP